VQVGLVDVMAGVSSNGFGCFVNLILVVTSIIMVTTKRERSPTFSESAARQTQLTHDLDSMAMSYRRFSVLQYVRHNNVIYKFFH
jgi:hypothetical protein